MKARVARLLLVSLVIVVAGFLLTSSFDRTPAAEARYQVSLQAPQFLSEEGLETDAEAFDIGEYLDDEAGISAWYKSTMPIDLEDVRDLCQVIEIEPPEAPDYLICSVSVPNYDDYWDQHVYVHVDGWILAYYMNTDFTGRMINAKGHTINSTLLEDTVATVAGLAGVPYDGATLYDFRHPTATHMLFVYEDNADGDTYTINMPTSYIYLERSWAKFNNHTPTDCTFQIDGEQATVNWSGSRVCIGTVSYAVLPQGVTHTVHVHNQGYDSYATLIVTYAVP